MTLLERISNAISDALFDTSYSYHEKEIDRIRSVTEEYAAEHIDELLKEFYPGLSKSDRLAFEAVLENFLEIKDTTRQDIEPTKAALEWLARAMGDRNDFPAEILIKNPRFNRLYPDAVYEMAQQYVAERIDAYWFGGRKETFAGEIAIIKDWLLSDEFKGSPREKLALVEKIDNFLNKYIKDKTDFTSIHENLTRIIQCSFLPREVRQEIIAYTLTRDDIKIGRTLNDVWANRHEPRFATAREIFFDRAIGYDHTLGDVQESFFGQFARYWIEDTPKGFDKEAIAQYALQFALYDSTPTDNIANKIGRFTSPGRKDDAKIQILEKIVTSPDFGSEKDEKLWLRIVNKGFSANFSDIYTATEIIKALGECVIDKSDNFEIDYDKVLDFVIENPQYAKEVASIEGLKIGTEEKLIEAVLTGKIKDFEIVDGKIEILGVKIEGKDVFDRIEAVADKYYIDCSLENFLLDGLHGDRPDLSFSIEKHIDSLESDGLFKNAKEERLTTSAMQLIYLANGVSFDTENASPNIKALASTLEFLGKNSSDLKFYLDSFSSEKDRLSTAEFADSPTYEKFLKLCDGIASEIEKLGSVKVAEYIKEHTPFEELKERLEPVIEKLEAENGRVETYDDDYPEDVSNPDENLSERKPDDNEKDNPDDDIE